MKTSRTIFLFVIALFVIAGVVSTFLKKTNRKQFIPVCEVTKKEGGDSNEVTYRTAGEFIYKIERLERKINAVETAISIKLNTKKNTNQTLLLLTTYTLSSKDSWPVEKATIKFNDNSTLVLKTEEHIEGATNESMKVTGNFFTLNKDSYTQLINKDITSILLEMKGDSYKITPYQKIIRSQLSCISQEVNRTDKTD